jgi:hypothetical protein
MNESQNNLHQLLDADRTEREHAVPMNYGVPESHDRADRIPE